jgi:hypothetical protein
VGEHGIRRPLNIGNPVVVASVCAVEDERCKLANEMVRGSPDLNVRFMGNCNEAPIGGKLDSLYGFMEIEVMQDNPTPEVDKESSTIWVL